MKKTSVNSGQQPLVRASARLRPEWIDESQYYNGGKSAFIREAIFKYKRNRHKFKFREILEILAGEILILTKWKEKGHPGGEKWSEKEEQQLEYYERCFDILENSPFNERLD